MKRQAIQAGMDVLIKNKMQVPDDISRAVQGLDNPQFRVAVVGRFQVGKSTLINNVFLKQDLLLKEGNGVCTTAVPTELLYGNTPKLEIYKWGKSALENAEELDRVVENPTASDIANITAANSKEEREDLAREIAAVKLYWPNSTLKQYTVIDTPGVDDPNPILLTNTTYRIIPDSDLALLVVGCQQLGEIELDLLRKAIFVSGMSRLMVLVSYRPIAERDPETRNEILSTIRAQLTSIGRESLPVEMICYDESVDGDILNTREEISLHIRAFLDENAMPGREEKAATLMRKALESNLIRIATELNLLGKSGAERQAFGAEINEKAKEVKAKHQEMLAELKEKFDELEQGLNLDFKKRLITIIDGLEAGINDGESLGAVQAQASKLDQKLRAEIEQLLFDFNRKMKEGIEQHAQNPAAKISRSMDDWNSFIGEKLTVEVGILGKVPPLILKLGDIVIFNLLLPGGWVVALLGRIIGKTIPLIKELGLEKLVLSRLRKSVSAGLQEVQTTILDGFAQKTAENMGSTMTKIEENLAKSIDDQVKTINKATASESTIGKRAEMEAIKAQLEAALLQL